MQRLSLSPLLPFALLASTLLVPVPTSSAQDCSGDPGYELNLPDTVALGKKFTIFMKAPGGSLAILLVGSTTGPLSTMFGDLCVGPPLIAVYTIPIPASGWLEFRHDVPCDPALDGMIGSFQFVALGPAMGQSGHSNSQNLMAVDDGSCTISLTAADGGASGELAAPVDVNDDDRGDIPIAEITSAPEATQNDGVLGLP